MILPAYSLLDVRSALDRIALDRPAARPALVDGVPEAAVAAVLRTRPAVELLFIRRAEHPLDPWSGHMALPGGRIDPGDRTPLDAARRETLEEVAADLAREAELLGELSPLQVPARTGRTGMRIHPFVFELRRDDNGAGLWPNHEVEELVWIPLGFLAHPGHRSRLRFTPAGTSRSLDLPSVVWEGRTVWGITLRIVDELVGALHAIAGETGAALG